MDTSAAQTSKAVSDIVKGKSSYLRRTPLPKPKTGGKPMSMRQQLKEKAKKRGF